MKLKLLILLVVVLSITKLIAQETEEKKPFSLKITGLIKSDFIWDSRQTLSAREGHFLLYPLPVKNDNDGNDVNSKPSFNFLSIQSTIGVDLTGPDVLKAKTSGKIEGDFFGQLNDNINLLRMRHAYIKLNWEKTEILFGQYWIPFFIPGCYPNMVSFNTGAPIQPFGRNPQIRITQKLGDFKLFGIVSSQRDYPNTGPNGASGEYLRNSSIPALDLQLHFDKADQEKGTALLMGIGGGYKKLVPKIQTNKGFSTSDAVESFSALSFIKVQLPAITMKFEAVLGQNIDDALLIGGYAVKDTVDAARGYVNYIPSKTTALWTDIHSNGKKWQFGIFAGYTKNNGFSEEIISSGTITGRATNIESLFRISPRATFSLEHIRFAFETEYTSANYGSDYNAKGIPINTVKADNLRLLVAVYYFIK